MRNKRFDYDETFPCGCGGGKSSCGVIGIVRFDSGELEIGFSNKESRYRGNTKNPHIYIDRTEVNRLIRFLLGHLADTLRKELDSDKA
jgi:hypothetical protein